MVAVIQRETGSVLVSEWGLMLSDYEVVGDKV